MKEKIEKLINEKLNGVEIKRHQVYLNYMLHNGFFDLIYYLENKNDFFKNSLQNESKPTYKKD